MRTVDRVSDLPKYLPLSQRPRRDETAVTADWSSHVRALLLQLADTIEPLDDERWRSVSDAAASTVWLVTTTRLGRLRARSTPALGQGEAAAALRTAAADTGKRGIAALSAAVVGTWRVAESLGLTLTVDPVASGAVALARSLSAPTPIRAVVQVRTLVATDADWRVGQGPVLETTASVIVLFLYGYGPLEN